MINARWVAAGGRLSPAYASAPPSPPLYHHRVDPGFVGSETGWEPRPHRDEGPWRLESWDRYEGGRGGGGGVCGGREWERGSDGGSVCLLPPRPASIPMVQPQAPPRHQPANFVVQPESLAISPGSTPPPQLPPPRHMFPHPPPPPLPPLPPPAVFPPEPIAFLKLEGALERTSSGHSISADNSLPDRAEHYRYEEEDLLDLISDEEAAQNVLVDTAAFMRRLPDSKHERILRSLIRPKTAEADFPLDHAALSSILSAVSKIFFNGRLAGRVTWDWSHPSSPQYEAKIIGMTAMRRCPAPTHPGATPMRGYETLVVLSLPILTDTQYNRRLLISTFIHELIHSYLFICCGYRAGKCGGHTEGFRKIAVFIDNWAGPGALHLCEMEADLDRFRQMPVHQSAAPAPPPQPLLPPDMLPPHQHHLLLQPMPPRHHHQQQQPPQQPPRLLRDCGLYPRYGSPQGGKADPQQPPWFSAPPSHDGWEYLETVVPRPQSLAPHPPPQPQLPHPPLQPLLPQPKLLPQQPVMTPAHHYTFVAPLQPAPPHGY